MKTRPDLALVSRMGAVFGVTVAVLAPVSASSEGRGPPEIIEDIPLEEPAQREVAQKFIHAVEGDDRAAFLELVAPQGITVQKRKLSLAALRKMLEKKAVIAVTRFNGDCQGECLQEWRTSPGRNKGEFALLNGSGYGRCPTAYFRKIDGSWRLIETRMVDHGAP